MKGAYNLGTSKSYAKVTENSSKAAQNFCGMVKRTIVGRGLLLRLHGTPQDRIKKICGEHIQEVKLQNKMRLDKCDAHKAKVSLRYRGG